MLRLIRIDPGFYDVANEPIRIRREQSRSWSGRRGSYVSTTWRAYNKFEPEQVVAKADDIDTLRKRLTRYLTDRDAGTLETRGRYIGAPDERPSFIVGGKPATAAPVTVEPVNTEPFYNVNAMRALLNVLANPPAIRAHAFLLHPLWIQMIMQRAGADPATIDSLVTPGKITRVEPERALYMDAKEASRVEVRPIRMKPGLAPIDPEMEALVKAGLLHRVAAPPGVDAFRFAGSAPDAPLLLPKLTPGQREALVQAHAQLMANLAKGRHRADALLTQPNSGPAIDTRALRALMEMGLVNDPGGRGLGLNEGTPAYAGAMRRSFGLTLEGEYVASLLSA